MRLRQLFSALLLAWIAGCATLPPAATPLHLTTNALLTQRAVLTVHDRQFTFNGYLALSETNGMRLVMTQSLGQVIADVLIKPDGAVYLMRPSPALRREWLEKYLARDMKCLFGNTRGPCPGHALDDTHFIVTDPSYELHLEMVATKPGPQPDGLFDETKAVK